MNKNFDNRWLTIGKYMTLLFLVVSIIIMFATAVIDFDLMIVLYYYGLTMFLIYLVTMFLAFKDGFNATMKGMQGYFVTYKKVIICIVILFFLYVILNMIDKDIATLLAAHIYLFAAPSLSLFFVMGHDLGTKTTT